LSLRFLLDTHILVRWFSDSKRLSREQRRVLEDTVRHGECVGVCGISLLEIAVLASGLKRGFGLNELFHELDTNPWFRIIPLTTDVAHEMAVLGDVFRDQWDRAIVATARVHRLRLLTADQRIIESDLVPVIE
jgi:PIN domain nuclease of toxin-antitoxin system